MYVTYTPDGGEPQRWEFRPGRVRASRAAMLERRYSKLAGGDTKTWDQFKADIQRGSADARRVLLWHLISMDHPTVRIEDVDPTEDELLVEHSRTELAELRAEVARTKAIDDEQREMILTRLDEEIATAPDDDAGKAPSTTSETGTS